MDTSPTREHSAWTSRRTHPSTDEPSAHPWHQISNSSCIKGRHFQVNAGTGPGSVRGDGTVRQIGQKMAVARILISRASPERLQEPSGRIVVPRVQDRSLCARASLCILKGRDNPDEALHDWRSEQIFQRLPQCVDQFGAVCLVDHQVSGHYYTASLLECRPVIDRGSLRNGQHGRGHLSLNRTRLFGR